MDLIPWFTKTNLSMLKIVNREQKTIFTKVMKEFKIMNPSHLAVIRKLHCKEVLNREEK